MYELPKPLLLGLIRSVLVKTIPSDTPTHTPIYFLYFFCFFLDITYPLILWWSLLLFHLLWIYLFIINNMYIMSPYNPSHIWNYNIYTQSQHLYPWPSALIAPESLFTYYGNIPINVHIMQSKPSINNRLLQHVLLGFTNLNLHVTYQL